MDRPRLSGVMLMTSAQRLPRKELNTFLDDIWIDVWKCKLTITDPFNSGSSSASPSTKIQAACHRNGILQLYTSYAQQRSDPKNNLRVTQCSTY